MTDLQISEVEHTIAERWLVEGAEVEAFGEQETIEKISGRYHLSLGNRPFARSVRAFYAANDRQLPPEFASLPGEVYLITHAVGIVADAHAERVRRVSYEASFEGSGSTVDLCPSTRFREWFGADLTFKAGIAANGEAGLPTIAGQLSGTVISLGVGAEVELAASAEALGQLRFSVKTPKVQAVGQAATAVTWQLDKDEKPLVGDQALVQTVVVPRGQETLSFQLQAEAMVNRNMFGWPVPLATEPITVEVDLQD